MAVTADFEETVAGNKGKLAFLVTHVVTTKRGGENYPFSRFTTCIRGKPTTNTKIAKITVKYDHISDGFPL